MALVVKVTQPRAPRNPVPRFRNDPNVAAALKLFRTEGAVLRVWRGSSPHNWWIENDIGDELHFTSESGNRDIPALLLAVGQPVDLAFDAGTIAPSWAHRDGGQPYAEGWKFDRMKLLLLEQLFASDQASRVSLQRRVAAFNPKLASLSDTALALLRTLRKGGLPLFIELVPQYLELAQQGLVSFTSPNAVRCVNEVRTLRIPRGHMLKVAFS